MNERITQPSEAGLVKFGRPAECSDTYTEWSDYYEIQPPIRNTI